MKKTALFSALLIAMQLYLQAQAPKGSMVWKWDTVVCYDVQGSVIQRLTQSFDNSGYPISQLIEEKSGNTWVNDSRISYENDNGGYVLTAVTDLWQSGNWISYTRLSVSYDASGKIILELIEKSLGSSWVNYVKRSYTYDGMGRKASMLQERWSNGAWKNDLRSTYSYAENENIVISEYSDDGISWLNGTRFSFAYDQNGYYIEMMIENWEDNHWKEAFRIDYTNDTEGNILCEWAHTPTPFGWVNDSRKNYTYDSNGNVLTGVNEIWTSGTWQPDMQSSYLYNKKEYLLLLNVPVYRYEATYMGFPLGMKQELAFGFNIYPNPANGQIKIDLAEMETGNPVLYIHDNYGKTVKKVQLNREQSQVDVSGLATGLYFLTIQTQGGSASGKLVIQKP
jgi:hypothetical protein